MTLTQLLKIECDGMDAASLSGLRFAERMWIERGRPTERESLTQFLEFFLGRSTAVEIRYPKILLRRKKEIERGDFLLEPVSLPAPVPRDPSVCPRCSGRGYTPIPGGSSGTLCVPCLGTGRKSSVPEQKSEVPR